MRTQSIPCLPVIAAHTAGSLGPTSMQAIFGLNTPWGGFPCAWPEALAVGHVPRKTHLYTCLSSIRTMVLSVRGLFHKGYCISVDSLISGLATSPLIAEVFTSYPILISQKSMRIEVILSCDVFWYAE
jgi:hypothetical protein